MAKNPWNDDPDLAAMRPKRGAMPWGRVLIGVLVVACGTFALAYYLPLHRAHRSLTDDHTRLRGQLESASNSLKQTQSDLKEAAAKRDELEADREKRESASKGRSAEAQTLKTKLASSLEKFSKKKLALVGADDAGVHVALSTGLLFGAGKLDVTASGQIALCEIAKASGSRPLRVIGIASDVPAALQAKFASAWVYASAAAASAADVLESKCSVAPSRLTSERPGAARAPGSTFGGDVPPATRVEVVISSSEAK
jgi:flagellar motor protein MotB